MIHRLKQLPAMGTDCSLGLEISVGDGTNGDCSKGGVGILVGCLIPMSLVGLSAAVVDGGGGGGGDVVICFSEDCCRDKSHRGILDAGSPISSITSNRPSIGEVIV